MSLLIPIELAPSKLARNQNEAEATKMMNTEVSLPESNSEIADAQAQPTTNVIPLKRYNLSLPQDVFNELQRIADQEHTTVLDLIRKFVKVGLLAVQIQNDPDAALIIREGSREREILIF